MKIIYLLPILLFLCSCSQEENEEASYFVIEIAARDEGPPENRPVIYRVKCPKYWLLQLPPPKESIADTTKAIADFFLFEGHEKIRIAIHNFPSDSGDPRIPPLAQTSRWKKQFQSLDQTSLSLLPQAFGGYHGYLMEATGQMPGGSVTILGWALQLAPEHYRALSQPVPPTLEKRHRQMRGDVTIKAVGPPALIAKHREEIQAFARSFQLIDDIP